MKSGKVIKTFKTKNGLRVISRTPRREDLEDLLEFINSLVDEKADIARTEKVGIAIKDGFRDIGTGTEMMSILIEQAKKIGLTVLVLTLFASNKRAIHVYRKVGFVKTGRVPKKFFRNGMFIDEIVMTKILE